MSTESADETVRPPIRAVVVDDSADVRFLLSTIMELDSRFEVVGEADTAQSGIALVDHMRPDVVLVDLHLGGRDGTWLIRELRSRNSDAALAVVTGSEIDDQHAAAFAAGADSVHNKVTMTSTMADDLVALVDLRASRISA